MTRSRFAVLLSALLLVGCSTSKPRSVRKQMVEIHDRNRPLNIDAWPAADREQFDRLLTELTKE